MKSVSKTINVKRLILYPLVTLLTVLMLGEYAFVFFKKDKLEEQKKYVDTLTKTLSEVIQKEIIVVTSATSMLETLLRQDHFATTNFNDWSREILSINENVSNLQLAPGGIVMDIFPLEGNEQAIGHDLLDDPKRSIGARIAVDSKELTFIGPVRLIQNNRLAVIARKPVFRYKNQQETFWGFTIALIYVEELMGDLLSGLDDLGLNYQLIGSNPDSLTQPIIAASIQPISNQAMQYPVLVPNGEWLLSVEYHFESLTDDFLYHGLILLMASLLSYFAFIYERKSQLQQIELVSLNQQLESLAYFDSLTGLRNRRSASDIAQELFHLAQHSQVPLIVAFLDIDYFKHVNDVHGHQAGDVILKALSNLCAKSCRESDIIARWGGEEFIVFLPYTDLDYALVFCETLRKNISMECFMYESEKIEFTISIGLSEVAPADKSIEDVIKRADEALYLAKKNGRNRCEVSLG
ncbi:diguanylate cyclase (GGDEF) domain-containing protein [Marinomonas polaris DSM 16579]|uniref:diguanylate cyclase n=1 Tax=Marinomonas polaris DSM 16579 TaxID=1122206 RepID=A0A1M5DRA1_9GAMM|nr:sensor domain-containing diguanylate cyclase [Marinomonas polaris]SHF69455.1 diguanylate cyclase (GGDEF) domain-containing protein [Marinomonas polaris DSM 16579]